MINSLLAANTKTDTVAVGDGATFLHFSDRSPGTVVKVFNFKTGVRQGTPRMIYIQPDDFKVISGSAHDGSAEYEIIQNPENPVVIAQITKRGWITRSGTRVRVGDRDAYYDPTF